MSTDTLTAVFNPAVQRLRELIDDETAHRVPPRQRQWQWSVACLEQVIKTMPTSGEFYDSQAGGAQ